MARVPLPDSLRPFIETREPVKPTAGDGDGHLDPAAISSWTSSGDADRYHDYQAARVARYVVGHSLFDVSAQTGEVSERLVKLLGANLERLVLSDQEQGWVDHLRGRFTKAEVLRLHLPSTPEIEPVDTVLMVNVLGHLSDEAKTIEALAKVIVPGGRFIVWEAGYPELYSPFDRFEAGRRVRYTPDDLGALLRAAGLRVKFSRPINLLGGLFNRFMVDRTVDYADPRLVRLYDRLVVPLSRPLDRLPLRFGQNVFAVAEVPGK
ncbi:class I SAM-dependent methyltransferase [Actinomadura citrea]|uniref:class I SAM-dependent methyltransferase n=1 Tax=Actinomadura citrea TaxID=46158 RepID=UPI002E2BD9C4|nr:methyltransferase domain-containing protein [Actinomadura citrea]